MVLKHEKGTIAFYEDDIIEIEDVGRFTIEELEVILIEAKAFRDYRNSRTDSKSAKVCNEPHGITRQVKEEFVKSNCGKSLVYSKEMLIESLQRKAIIEHSNLQWSHGGEYQPFNPDQTLIPKEHVIPHLPFDLHTTKMIAIKPIQEQEPALKEPRDNDIKEVIEIKKAHENKLQVLKEVPAFHSSVTECTYHKCNNSQYWITQDGRIGIDPPEPYDVYIYTTVDEIQRLLGMTADELMMFYRAYEKQTYPNKRYALRAFLRDIADSVFPPVPVEPTVTPEPADDTPAPNVEYPESELEATPTPTPEMQPIDPYVLRTRMSKKTAALWDKFADPAKVK